jgi:hypothetical protein
MSQSRALILAAGVALAGLGCTGQLVDEDAPGGLIKTTVVTKNADGTLSRSVHFLTADQMELEKQQRAAWIDQQKRGLLADLTFNSTCPFNDDDVWVYTSPNLVGGRCCIVGIGTGYFSDICGPSWKPSAVDGGPVNGGHRIEIGSLWGGRPSGYVRNENGCADAYGRWEEKDSFQCQPQPNWIDVGETF